MKPVDRDPALLPGPTAQQLDGRARIALGCAVVIAAVALLGIAFGAAATVGYLAVAGILFAAGFVAWIVFGAQSQSKLTAELVAGYSTKVDAAGYDLRHPITGALERSREVPPAATNAVRRSFLLDAFRGRQDAAPPIDPQHGSAPDETPR